MKKIYIALAVLLGLVLTGCATASAPSDLTAVHYSGGVASAKKFQDCLKPSERSGYDPGDGFYFYPTRNISYEASKEAGSERGRFSVVSDDNAELYIPVRITFQLDTKCETLRKFHEEIGSRYTAYIKEGDDTNDDGETTSADYPKGWVNLLNDIIGKPADATLDRIAQKYPWRDVWNNENIRVEMENELEKSLEDMVNQQAGGDFFKDFQVLLTKPDPVDAGLKAAITAEQNAIAEAKAATAKAEADAATTKAKAEADEAAATAQLALARAQSKTKQAEIEAYGGIDNYLRYQCISTPACGNPYRDQFLYGGSPAKAAE